jgi:nitroreductase
MDAMTAMQRRTSVRRFRPDPVPREAVEAVLDCAVRAPNHKLTEPWRFAVLTGAAKSRFAEVRGRVRRVKFADPSSPEAIESADKMRAETEETPVVIVVMCAISRDEMRREEDYAATMMAVENLLIAAESLELGTYVRTGGMMRDPELAAIVKLEEDFRIVAMISLGYPAEPVQPRRRRPAAELTRWLNE